MSEVRAEKALGRVHELRGKLVVISECPCLPLPMASANRVKVGKAERASRVSTLTGAWWGGFWQQSFLLFQDPGAPADNAKTKVIVLA